MRETGVFTLALILLFAALSPVMIGGAYDDKQVNYSVENESVTVDYDNASVLSPEPEAFSFGNATVYNSTGAKLNNGTDYEWRPSVGEIGWFNTSATSDNESASVTYDYDGPTQRAYNIASLVQIILVPVGYIILIAGAGMSLYYAIGRGSGW
ncbi:MAG: hypothetical protein ABEI98_02520 [Halorhabdus sp.]